VLARILGIILPVFLIILVGYLYARRVKPDMAMVNRISMTILAPALIFRPWRARTSAPPPAAH
jgi:predicted permease